jgi:diadenosine tetraphosphate (Ap4A) HIT family hydrolase
MGPGASAAAGESPKAAGDDSGGGVHPIPPPPAAKDIASIPTAADGGAAAASAPSWKDRMKARMQSAAPAAAAATTSAVAVAPAPLRLHIDSAAAAAVGNDIAQLLDFTGTPIAHKAPASTAHPLQPVGTAAAVAHSASARPPPQQQQQQQQQQHVAATAPAAASAAAPTSAAPVPSAADLNKLHAALLRAKMLGDAAKCARIQAEVDAAVRAQTQAQAAAAQSAIQLEAAVANDCLPAASRPSARTGGGLHPSESVRLDAPSMRATGDERAPVHGYSRGSATGAYREGTTAAEEGAEAAVEVIAPFDARGMPLRSLQSGQQAPLHPDDLRQGSRKGKHKAFVNKLDSATGEATALLPSDVADQSTVADLLREERQSGTGDFDRQLAANITRRGGGTFKLAELGASRTGADEDDAGATEDLARLVQSKDYRLTEQARQQRDKQRAVQAHTQMEKVLNSCRYCFNTANPDFKKYLVIALGEHSLLMVPPEGPILPGHMVIVPLPHIVAMTDADEEVYDEVNRFKAALQDMYVSQGEDALFLETSMHHGRRRHTRVDVIPMDKELAFDAPLYFKQAIVGSEEWATNKELIDTKGKGLRRSIPKGFAYFHVGWQGGGYVHAIDNEETFPESFGIDVCAGMLGLPPGRFGRKAQRLSVEQERTLVLDFVKQWEPFDWTQTLDGGN